MHSQDQPSIPIGRQPSASAACSGTVSVIEAAVSALSAAIAVQANINPTADRLPHSFADTLNTNSQNNSHQIIKLKINIYPRDNCPANFAANHATGRYPAFFP